METFTFSLPRLRGLSGLGRNPLLRRSDRIESIVMLLAVLVAVISIPIAAAIGTSVHERQLAANAQYSASLRQVQARVVGDVFRRSAPQSSTDFWTPVRWDVDGTERTGAAEWPTRTHRGDVITVWVDRSGELRAGPIPDGRATLGATAVALASWTGIVGVVGALLWASGWFLDRGRYDAWGRELETLADDGSRHRD